MTLRWQKLLPRYVLLTLFMLVVLIPIWGLLMSTFKTDTEIITSPFGLPEGLSLDNFRAAWSMGKFNISLRNLRMSLSPRLWSSQCLFINP